MRKVLIFCIILFIILSAAPLLTSYIAKADINTSSSINNVTKENKEINTKPSTSVLAEISTESTENSEEKEYLLSLAVSLSDESFCDEGLKAALAIAKNNFEYEKDSISITAYSDEIYDKLEKLYDELDVSLLYQGECVYIPTAELTCGSTVTSQDYPYIKAVASPWDCFSEDFIYGKDYSNGISMYGINYLCNEGFSYKEALKWYLPDFDIK